MATPADTRIRQLRRQTRLVMGRPTKYTPKLGSRICRQITEGIPVRRICSTVGISVSTLFLWLETHADFSEQYARAREVQAQVIADEILEIADTPLIGEKVKEGKDGTEIITGDNVDRSKLKVDARKWVAAKLLPKKYGDLRQVEHSGTITLETLICGDSASD